MITIVCTSKPHDGLFYYSCEYLAALQKEGVEANMFVVPFPGYSEEMYYEAIDKKYENFSPELFTFDEVHGIILIMGRSMLTLPYLNFNKYDHEQQFMLKMVFGQALISVYSENHIEQYPRALEFFKPEVIDLCDHEVYKNGVGFHFEKRINFDIYKTPVENVQFEHVFMGTNRGYYERIMEVIHDFPSHGIITYDEDYINPELNNVFVPIDNLLGMFNKYVYTKNTFDPAPRIIQECKWLGKEIIYLRNDWFRDGGHVYYNRELSKPDVSSILEAMKELQ